MIAWKDDFQSGYWIGLPLKMVGSGAGRRLMLNDSVIAVIILPVGSEFDDSCG